MFPQAREQRCWFHKIANVLNCLPKSAQPGAKAALAEIWNAEDKDHAKTAARAFAADYGVKWPKVAAKISDYPAEHWVHLRTTNPIESTFATVRLRQRVTKGPRIQGRQHRYSLIPQEASCLLDRSEACEVGLVLRAQQTEPALESHDLR